MTPPSPHLRAVPSARATAASLAERIAAHQNEARGLATQHLDAFRASMADTGRLATEIAAGGEAYPAGVRDYCRRLADRIEADLATVGAISVRAG